MKFFEDWIREYHKNNLNIKNIIYILNKNGFEINNNILNINKKYTIKKVYFYKKINNKISKIKINNNNNFIYIKNIKENIKYKNILIKKKYIKKKIQFKYCKIQIQNNFIYILYIKNKKKKIKLIKKYNYLEINIPYNRFDCNNIYGLSRELNILFKKKIYIKKKKIKKNIKNNYFININIWNKKIKNYKYLLIKKINLYKFKTPNIIKKRLKKLEIKYKNNITDIFLYILIESGQKIICLSLDKIKEYINNKYLNNIKKITLKKKSIKQFRIKNKTKNILLLAPLYNNKYIKKIKKNILNIKNKYLNNNDEYTQNYFLEKCIYIIKKICGGKISNIIKIKRKIKKKKYIKLPYKNITNKIGINIKKKKIINFLKQIKCKLIKKKNFLYINPPKWRNDLKIQEDFIEEIIKNYGFNKICSKSINSKLIFNQNNYFLKEINKIKNNFTSLGYKEVINFHFSNYKEINILNNKKKYIKIFNPLSQNMTLMRTSLIPGLIKNIHLNTKKQNKNIKIFEIGTCYKKKKKKIIQENIFSAAISGYRYTENWFIKKNYLLDFYDIKGDLEFFFKKNNKFNLYNTKKSKYKILDKKQNIKIIFKKKNIGFMGMLNKKIQKYFSFKHPIFIFEIKIKNILIKINKKITNISKFQSNFRDITLIISNKIWITKIIKKCLLINKNRIKKVYIIKIYKNKKLEKKNKKNITLRIKIQDNYKTLNEYKINKIINKCKKMLKKKFSASIKD